MTSFARRAWRRLAPGVALCGAVALAGCVAAPATKVSLTTFDISGRSLNQLAASTQVHGPRPRGSPVGAFAAVEPQFNFAFRPRQSGATCRYEPRGTVELETLIRLPRWREEARASPELAAKWAFVTRYAIAHELVHVRIYQRFARKVEATSRALEAPTCEQLGAAMTREYRRLAVAMAAEHAAFDRFDYPRFAILFDALERS